MPDYHRPRWGAIALGVLCAAGAAAVLLEDVATTGPTTDHALSIIALVATIAAGHMAVAELLAWRALRAVGLALVFAGGITYTIVSTAGRAVESETAAAATAAARNQARADKAAELARARQRREQAEAMAEREMTGQRCQQRCQDWKLRASEVSARVGLLEAELARLGGEQAVNAKLAGFARLVALLSGKSETAIAASLTVGWPYVRPLLLELGSIMFWSIGLAGWRRRAPVVTAWKAPARSDSEQTSFPPLEPDWTPPAARQGTAEVQAREEKVRAFVDAYFGRHGRMPSAGTVAAACGLPRATAHRYQVRCQTAAQPRRLAA